jgi:hypothetical protein
MIPNVTPFNECNPGSLQPKAFRALALSGRRPTRALGRQPSKTSTKKRGETV